MTKRTRARKALMVHPSSELYGSDRVFAESVYALLQHSWQVTVALPQDGPLVAPLRAAGARVIFCPTPVLRKAALKPRGFLRLLAETGRAFGPMARLLRSERPDVVYVNTVTIPMWLALARASRCRVLAHVHEAEDTVPTPIQFALAAPLYAAHSVVVNSKATGTAMLRAGVRLSDRTHLVYNGVAGPESPRPIVAPPREPARILLVGRLSPRKGSDLAIRSIARLIGRGREVRLDLVGSVFTGYEWYENQLRELIAELDLSDSVRLRGFNGEVWDAYAGADVAIVPSRFEPFGNTAIEAQLAGVPVIVTDAQGLPETVEHGHYGEIVPVDDAEALADAIANTLDNWQESRSTAESAQRRARTRFNPQRYRQRIASIAGG